MIEYRKNEINALAEINDGKIFYSFKLDYSPVAGDAIAAYIGDHEIDKKELLYDEKTGQITGEINILLFPLVSFPAVVRAIALDGSVVLPNVIFNRHEDLLDSVPWDGSRSKIKSISESEIMCEVVVNSLPHYTRKFILTINDNEVANSQSEVVSNRDEPASALHNIRFKIERAVTEFDVVKIIDKCSGITILTDEINAFITTKIALDVANDSKNQIKQLKDEVKILKGKLDFIVNMSVDKEGLERIDIYYELLNAKINRMSKTDAENSEPGEVSDAKALAGAKDYHESLFIKVSEIEGVGVYELETNGHSEWKWVAPRVTLALKNVPRDARTLVFCFGLFKPESNADAIQVYVNGCRYMVNARMNRDKWELHVPLREKSSLIRDNNLIIHIHFQNYFQPNGDIRLLSALLNHIYYEI